ncbi:MAG: hypothetical protein IH835_08325 [Proteobacteria bacterium]|nr:hypothetical protein [Pseudomonadota bacterium]
MASQESEGNEWIVAARYASAMLPGIFGGRTRKREMKVPEALEYLIQEEEQKLVDPEQVARLAVERTRQRGKVLSRPETLRF